MKKITKYLTLSLLAATVALQGCTRPTPQDSTYHTDFDNDFVWDGMGPAGRIWLPTYSSGPTLVSHKSQTFEFPII